ncbi:MAG: MFS transporter [Cyanobacteria bacterium P01_E01_bin.43]
MIAGLRENWALLAGVAMIMIGNGLMSTLLTIRGLDIGFSTATISFIQLGYPAGALLGTLFIPRIISHVGHVRAFSALASICSAAAILHLMSSDVIVWAVMRVVAGICFPGLYVITESWLNAKAQNTNRAQLLSMYFITQSIGSALGVWLAGLNDLSGANLFGLVSIVLSLAIVPLLLSARPAPSYEAPERMSVGELYRVSPMALTGATLSGAVAGGIFVGVPVYALATGASAALASGVLALATLCGALAFFPAGWVSDRADRRNVILVLALGATVLSALEALSPGLLPFQAFNRQHDLS